MNFHQTAGTRTPLNPLETQSLSRPNEKTGLCPSAFDLMTPSMVTFLCPSAFDLVTLSMPNYDFSLCLSPRRLQQTRLPGCASEAHSQGSPSRKALQTDK